MNAFEESVFKILKTKYMYPEWVLLKQVKTSTGVKDTYGGSRYIDFFIMNCYPSKNYKCIAIEAKQSISDFRSDINNPHKQTAAHFYSDVFYYLVTKKMYEKNKKEIDDHFYLRRGAGASGDGLLIFDGENIETEIKPFSDREKSPFSFGFVASLLRNQV